MSAMCHVPIAGRKEGEFEGARSPLMHAPPRAWQGLARAAITSQREDCGGGSRGVPARVFA